MSGNNKKNVAVIGAGPSGLAAVKGLLEEGHQATCFEKSNDLGGVYRYAPDSVGVYESAQLTSSARITSFSDFPPPPGSPFHFKHQEYFQYLHDYAGQFGLAAHIKLQHQVNSVERLEDGTWRLKVLNMAGQKEEQYIFDAVAVCAGVHQKAVIPDIADQEIFKGKILHSGYYKVPGPFQGQNVVVVGGGESGSDIIEEVSRVAKSCSVSLRRGILVIPRLVFGVPNDYYVSRLFDASPQWFLKQGHKGGIHWPTILVISLFISASFGILIFIFKSLSGLSLANSQLAKIGFYGFALYFLVKNLHHQYGHIGLKESAVIGRLFKLSRAGRCQQFATKCEGIARAIARKQCSLKPGIQRFTATGVEFTDGTGCEADTVIFCTGYVITYPFLAIDRLDCRELYKNCFDPSLGPTLCFLGLARPAVGAIPPISEMQARWFAQIVSGKCHLPVPEKMKLEIAKDAGFHKDFFAVNSDRITGLVDFLSYMDQLAELAGCKPRWKDVWMDPVLVFRLYFNPFMACQFRLAGPHRKRELARKTMTSVPIGFFQVLSNGILLGFGTISEILYRLGFKYFKPHVRLD